MLQQRKSLLLSTIAVLFWSTAATVFKLTLDGLPQEQVLFYSSLISTIVLFIFLYIKNPEEIKNTLRLKYLKNNFLLGLFNPFLYYMVLFKAYSLIPAQEAMALNYTWPLVIAVFSSIFLKQKLSLKIILGMLIAFGGVLVIATRGDLLSFKFHNLLGVSLALFSSVVWASFWILNLIDKRTELSKLFSGFVFGTLLVFIYIFLFSSFTIDKPIYLFGVLYIGLFEMSITFTLWMIGLQLSNNKAKTSTIANLSPFFSLMFISLVLGEKLFVSSIIGVSLVVLGIAFQYIKPLKTKNPK